ncbi:tetratricopeptide repeat protein [Kordiimonas sp.]|uniref:tetratricopeptide repeat protein n=1 Tax=Kordiimonas sp. TaxID=1970157 RepID=UPI003A8EC896
MKPITTIFLALALVACTTEAPKRQMTAPVSGSLHSEFEARDDGASFYGPFVAATLAQHNEEYAEAARYYLSALSSDPDSRFVADRAFFQLLYAGRMEDAGKLAVNLQEREGGSNDDLVRIMYVLEAYHRQDWPEVRNRLSATSDTGFGFLVSPILEAWSHAAEQDLPGAEAALAPLLSDPRLKSIGEEHKAYILDHLQHYEAATTAYLALANAEKPSSYQPMVAYAHMLFQQGDTVGARDFLGEQTKRFNNNTFLLRESMRMSAGYPPSQDAATPNGAAGAMFYSLGSEFAHGQSSQAAVVYMRIASYLMPEVAEIYLLLGDLLERLEIPAAAASAYASVPDISPLRQLAHIKHIGALRSAGETGAAEDLVRRGLREDPNDQTLLVTMGDILRERKDYTEAIVYYGQAIDQLKQPRSSDWFVFFARGVCFEQLGDWGKAEADLVSALRLKPNEPSVLNYLGYSWIDRGKNVDEAKGLIEKAIEQTPNDGFIMDSFGWVHYLTGDFSQAVDLLEQAVRLEPTDPTINHHLGDAYWRVGRKIEARFQWRHALDSEPTETEKTEILQKLAAGLPELS